MKSPEKQIGRAFLLNFAGLIVNKGSVFVTLLLVSRILGPDDYGRASIIVNTTSLFASLAALNLGLVATKYIAQYRVNDIDRLNRILALVASIGVASGFLFALTLFVFAEPIAVHQLGSEQMAPYLRIGAITVAFTTYNGIQRGIVTGFERFKTLMRIDSFSGVVTFLLGVFGTILFGAVGYITALMIASVLTNGLYFVIVRHLFRSFGVRYDVKGCLQEKNALLGFALPMSLAGLAAAPANWICGVIIVNTADGYASYGMYSAAFQWRSIIMLIMSTFGNAMLPILVSSDERSSQVEKLNLLVEWFASIVIVCVLVPASNSVSALYGAAYDRDIFGYCLVAIAFSCIVASYMDGINRKMMQRDKMWYSFVANVIWALSFIALTYLFRDDGATGIAYALLCSYAIMLVVVIAMSIKLKVIDTELVINAKTTFVWVLLACWCVFCTMESFLAARILSSMGVLTVVVVVFRSIYGLKQKRDERADADGD